MEKKMKNRIALLCCLVVAGLILASIGNIFGVGDLLRGGKKGILNLPEHEGVPEKWIEIAQKDSRIQEIIEGKEWSICGKGIYEFNGMNVASLMFEVEDRCYEIKIDLDNERIIGIEERHFGHPWIEIAQKDSRIQEIIEGKEWEMHVLGDSPIGEQNDILLKLCAGGKNYSVTINPDNKVVTSLGLIDPTGWFEIAKKDAEVQELIAGKTYELIYTDQLFVMGWLVIDIEGNHYFIHIDLNNETVDWIHKLEIPEYPDPLEIAKKDDRVQKLIAGKEYDVVDCAYLSQSTGTVAISSSGEEFTDVSLGEEKALLMLNVEGKHYRILVDLRNEAVELIEGAEYGWFGIVKKDPRVQELIAGKEYKIVGSGRYGAGGDPVAVLILDVEGRHYEITINLLSGMVESIEEKSQ
jgi:hypothetical protein